MRNPVQTYLEDLAAAHAEPIGTVAQYIPELAKADPDTFALAVAPLDGYIYRVGDCEHRFSIQSISKPFTYALALADRGLPAVAAKVDVEPTGEAFNEISLESDSGRPRNPMINAGALTAASLVRGDTAQERFERVRQWYSDFAGRDLGFLEDVYRSEIATAHRNRAIAHMLREFGILEGDPEETLDLYIRQCAIEVTATDLAMMAATLANGGIQPRTGKRVMEPNLVEHVLSVMLTCGMYDAAGDWTTTVGMPAKSGVSGGILSVLPGQIGVAVFSPRLDSHGNSARGVALCETLADEAELHLMHVTRSSRTAVKEAYTLADYPSQRQRRPEEQQALDEVSERCWIYELHGDLLFGGVESVVRRVAQDAPEIAVLDVRNVDDVAEVSRVTLLALQARLRETGSEGVLIDPDGLLPDPDAGTQAQTRIFPDRDSALLWCEEELLRRSQVQVMSACEAQEHPLLHDLSPRVREQFDAVLQPRQAQAGEVVLEMGAPFAGIHIITRGEAVARFVRRDGERYLLATMGPGTSFGEFALGAGRRQPAEVTAETDLTMLVLTADALQELTEADPATAAEVWQAIARDGYRVAERAFMEGARRARRLE